MICLRCQSDNSVGAKYCGACGAALELGPFIETAIQGRVERELKDRLKDNKVAIVEITDALRERVLTWFKIVGIPLALIASGLTLVGVQSVKIFSTRVARSKPWQMRRASARRRWRRRKSTQPNLLPRRKAGCGR
jgi:hypothetical protein